MTFVDKRESDDMDLYLTYTDDNGGSWAALRRINDDPVGNGVFQAHPWIDVNTDGVVTIVWMDHRLGGTHDSYDLFAFCSFDGGQTFLAPQRISTVSSFVTDASMPRLLPLSDVHSPDAPTAGLLGEYIGVDASTKAIHPIWTDTRNGHQDAYTATVYFDSTTIDLVAPEDGHLVSQTDRCLMWTPRFDPIDITPQLQVQLSSTADFASADFSFDLTQNNNFFDLPDLEQVGPGLWYWRVIDYNNDQIAVVSPSVRSIQVPYLGCCLPNYRGDLNGDGANGDIVDITFLADYLFGGGPPPQCDDEADVNSDGSVADIVDLTYLADFLFAGGPIPVDCF
jgi:hypothetical protein